MKNLKNSQDSYNLLNSSRFDLAFKLLYLDLYKKSPDLAENIYKDHIRAFSLGRFIEPGNKKKVGIKKFLKDFKNIYFSIKQNGFYKNKPLPVSKSGIITNGSHRLASSLHLSKKIFFKFSKDLCPNYNFEFFIKRKVNIDFIEIAAIKFIQYCKHPYLAIVWPSAKDKNVNIEEFIPNIIYKKSFFLNVNAAKIFLSEVYKDAKWIGSSSNNYNGIDAKLLECFDKKGPVTVYAFHFDRIGGVKLLKDNIRKLCGIGKSSIHITDSKKESFYLAKLCFNNNSLHFLNNLKINKDFKVLDKILTLKKFIKKKKISFDDIVFTGSFVMSLYGIRKFVDIDYISENKVKKEKNSKHINSHNSEERFYSKEINQLIYNPVSYFNFQDLKFLSLQEIYKMKKKRNYLKDKNDYKMISSYLSHDKRKLFYFTLLQNLYYLSIKLRYDLIIILKLVKLYNFCKKLIILLKKILRT